MKNNLANTQILLFTGEHDTLVNPNDYKILTKYLPSGIKEVQVADYNHLDYMWASDVNENINSHVMDFLNSF